MSNTKYIDEKLQKNETVYLLNDFEEIVIKISLSKGQYKVIAKFKGKSKADEYEIDSSTNLAMDTRLGGDIITKEEYNNY